LTFSIFSLILERDLPGAAPEGLPLKGLQLEFSFGLLAFGF
jgi:hypothetical protein